ncbi:MAG: hypothetical protein AAB631_02400 [Patescibacteria group bacterium]
MQFFRKKFFVVTFVSLLVIGLVAAYVPLFFGPQKVKETPEQNVPVPSVPAPVATTSPVPEKPLHAPAEIKLEPAPQPTPPPPVTGGKSLEELQKILNR